MNDKILDTPYYDYYTVKKGDTLYNISKEYDVNTDLLAYLNGIKKEDYIYPNQTILLPKSDVKYYITKKNDTLKDVANIFDTSVEELVKENNTIYLLEEQMIFNRKY